MEFDEIKQIWKVQDRQPLYAIDEKVLQKRVQSKMSLVLRVTHISEWSLIFIYLGTGGVLLAFNPLRAGANVFLYLEAAWLFVTVAYIVVHNRRRIRAGRQFDRSVRGDLDHAISVAAYQVRLSQLIRWNLLPMGVIMLLSGWEAGKFVKVGVIIVLSYTLAFFVSSKGYRMNIKRKRELQVMKEKLEAGQ